MKASMSTRMAVEHRELQRAARELREAVSAFATGPHCWCTRPVRGPSTISEHEPRCQAVTGALARMRQHLPWSATP